MSIYWLDLSPRRGHHQTAAQRSKASKPAHVPICATWCRSTASSATRVPSLSRMSECFQNGPQHPASDCAQNPVLESDKSPGSFDEAASVAYTDDSMESTASSLNASIFSTDGSCSIREDIEYESDGTMTTTPWGQSTAPSYEFQQLSFGTRPNSPDTAHAFLSPQQLNSPQIIQEAGARVAGRFVMQAEAPLPLRSSGNLSLNAEQAHLKPHAELNTIANKRKSCTREDLLASSPDKDACTRNGAKPSPGTASKRLKGSNTNSRRYACPFAKHDRERYENVHNSCTAPPGLGWGRVLEHLARVHSARDRCIYCGQQWSNKTDFENELKKHIKSGSCRRSLEERLCLPESMTAPQEKAFRKEHPDRLEPDEKWVALYMRLFPGEWPIPTPGYDFLVLRHRIEPLVVRSNSLPLTFGRRKDDEMASCGPTQFDLEDTGDD